MDLGLRDTVALVTGSSRGIGLAIAGAFLRERARVILTGRSADRLAEATAQLGGAVGPDRVHGIAGDLSQASDVRRVWEEALAHWGRLNVVVANVGTGKAKNGWDLAPDDWAGAISQNLLGSMYVAPLALDHFSGQGKGNLVFISSIAGMEAIGAPVTYGAAKAALGSAVKSLSRLAGPKGVRVNAVAPGNVLFPGGSWEAKLAERQEFFATYIQNEVPLQRFGTPEEIADAVVFLASERAAFITGSCLVVDGGQTRGYF